MAKKEPDDKKIIVQNKKARHNYFIEETLEAGIVLYGSEVKSLRDSKANLNDSYAEHDNGEIFLINAHIAEYKGANRFNHKPKRNRKLLLHRREIKKLIGKLEVKGATLVPLSLYFNKHNKVKIELGIAKGKKLYDKRETIKQKDWDREKQRMMKEKFKQP